MNAGENVRSGLTEIWGHKLRSALTLVGVVLGVFSINCMFSIIGGVRQSISGLFYDLGFDGMVFISQRPLDREQKTAWNLWSKGLTIEDAEDVRGLVMGRGRLSPVAGGQAQVEIGTVRATVKYEAANEDYLGIRNMTIAKGRGLTLADIEAGTPVVVIGPKVATDLFGGEDPLGKEVPIGHLRFRVVGVIAKKDVPRGMGGGGDIFDGDTAYVPISAFAHYLVARPTVMLAIKADPGVDFYRLADEVRNRIAQRHHGSPDFEVENVAEDMLQARDDVDKMLSHFNIVLGCIAGAALLVGGIGILSVMLIAVSERLFEIGIRKAVGATDSEILLQFLVEASTLSILGALLGTGAALLVVTLLSSKFPMGLHASAGGLSLAAFFALAIGLGFGLYPAWLASRMDPVEALRAS